MNYLKNRFEQFYKGSVALPTVILISTVLLIGGLSLVTISIDVRKATKGYAEHTQASLEAKVCLEETIQILKFEQGYTGSFELTFPTGSCDSVTSNIGESTTLKEVVITSEYNSSQYRKVYQVDVSNYPLTITEM